MVPLVHFRQFDHADLKYTKQNRNLVISNLTDTDIHLFHIVPSDSGGHACGARA